MEVEKGNVREKFAYCMMWFQLREETKTSFRGTVKVSEVLRDENFLDNLTKPRAI